MTDQRTIPREQWSFWAPDPDELSGRRRRADRWLCYVGMLVFVVMLVMGHTVWQVLLLAWQMRVWLRYRELRATDG